MKLASCLLAAAAAAYAYSQPLIDGPFIMFIGPPGSGKTTQAVRAAKYLRIRIISAEQMVSSNPGAFTRYERTLISGLSGVEPRGDTVMNSIFGALIASGDFKRGVIVDGYPASKGHADYVRDLVMDGRAPIPILIQLDLPDDEVRRRSSKQPANTVEQRLKDYHREMDMLQIYFPAAEIHFVAANRSAATVAREIRGILRGRWNH